MSNSCSPAATSSPPPPVASAPSPSLPSSPPRASSPPLPPPTPPPDQSDVKPPLRRLGGPGVGRVPDFGPGLGRKAPPGLLRPPRGAGPARGGAELVERLPPPPPPGRAFPKKGGADPHPQHPR